MEPKQDGKSETDPARRSLEPGEQALVAADEVDRADEAAAFRAIGDIAYLRPPVARRRVKELVGPLVYRAIQPTNPTTLIHGPHYALILQLLPFFKNIFVTVCPRCGDHSSLRMLMPLVERGLVIPILLGGYGDFPRPFLEEVAPYPHVRAAAFSYLCIAQMHLRERQLGTHLGCCSHCHDKLADEVEEVIAARAADSEDRTLSREALTVFRLPCGLTHGLLKSLRARVVEREGLVAAVELAGLAKGITALTESVALSSVLTLERSALGSELVDPAIRGIPPETIGAASLQLGLASCKDIPLCDYLKIIEPHIGSCASLLLTDGQPARLDRVLERTRDISAELVLAARSRRAKIANTVLTVVGANPSLLTGLLGGAVGLAVAGLAGCGLGTVGGAVTSIAAKAAKVRLPSDALDDLHDLIQPLSLRALEYYYGFGSEAAHIWSIRSQSQKLLGPRGVQPRAPVLVVESNAEGQGWRSQ